MYITLSEIVLSFCGDIAGGLCVGTTNLSHLFLAKGKFAGIFLLLRIRWYTYKDVARGNGSPTGNCRLAKVIYFIHISY